MGGLHYCFCPSYHFFGLWIWLRLFPHRLTMVDGLAKPFLLLVFGDVVIE